MGILFNKSSKKRSDFSKYIALTMIILLRFSLNVSANSEQLINYRSLLSDQQTLVYNQVFAMATTYESGVVAIAAPISEQALEDTMNCFYSDHPEVFWINTAYRYTVNSSGTVTKIQLKYGISVESLGYSQIIYEQQLNNLVTAAMEYADPVERERFIHDYICKLNSYCENSDMNQSSYSAIVGGSSVCAGYARAFQIACLRAGIPCYYITGESKGQNHAWNMVYINGQYYYVDLTWNDAISEARGRSSYNYFNKTAEEFSVDHTLSPLSAQIGHL